MSWHLQRAGRDHVVLDRRETLGGGWQDRWDGFRLVSPNWTSGCRAFPTDDPDPDGFMARDAMVARMAPIRERRSAPRSRVDGGHATGTGGAGRPRFRPGDNPGRIDARRGHRRGRGVPRAAHPGGRGWSVGLRSPAPRPRLPAPGPTCRPAACSRRDRPDRRPARRGAACRGPDRGICGRPLRAGPRRYRGRDFFWWVRQLVERGAAVGATLRRSTTSRPTAPVRLQPALLGARRGPRDEPAADSPRRDSADRSVRAADGERVTFAARPGANLRFADAYFDQRFKPLIETFAERTGLEPRAGRPTSRPTYEPPEVERSTWRRRASRPSSGRPATA